MKPKITFKELKVLIARAAGISQRQVQDLFRETLAVIKLGLRRDGHVTITGIGRFHIKEKAARMGRHPRTGEPLVIPAQRVVRLKPDAGLRRFINRAYADQRMEPLTAPTPLAGERIIPADFKRPAEPDASTAAAPEATAALDKPAPAPEIPPPTPPTGVMDARDLSGTSPSGHAKGARKSMIIGGVLVLLLAIGGLFVILNRQPDLAPPIASTTKAMVSQEQTVPKMVAAVVEPKQSPAPPPAIVESKPPAPSIYRQKIAAVTSAHAAPVAEKPVAKKPAPKLRLRYTVRPGDNLWRIADATYTAPYLWPNIYRVNQDILLHPDALEVGDPIRIPMLEGTAASMTHRDIANTATGYFFVYKAYRRTDNPQAPFYLWVAYRLDGDRLRETHAAVDPDDLEFIESLQGKDLIRQSVAIGFKMLFSSLKMPLFR